jgi:hypothetical protein
VSQRLVATGGSVVAERVHVARSFSERARGLLGRPPLGRGDALVIEPARSVHTFGMRYAIDVCFCDRSWVVVRVVADMPPGRVTRWVRRARFVVEMRAGSLWSLRPGDQLSIEELNDR